MSRYIVHAGEWGTVYVIQFGNLYKIGYTYGLVCDRLRGLRVGNPGTLKLICEIRSPTAPAYERALHSRYASKHVHGEWYRLTRDDLNVLKAEAAIQLHKCMGELEQRLPG